MKLRTYIYLILLLSACIPCAGQQIVPRVEGLRGDTVYMSLLTQERRMVQKEDSISRRLADVRNLFRSNPDDRAKYTGEIVALEEQLFDVRNQTGILTGKINRMEQEWAIANIGRTATPAAAPNGTSNGKPTGSNFIDSKLFSQNIPEKEYAWLKKSPAREQAVSAYLKIYMNNYQSLKTLEADYTQAQQALAADSVLTEFRRLEAINAVVQDSIKTIWTEIFDNKIYAYSYLMDKQNRTAMLEQFARKTTEVKRQEGELSGRTQSDAIAFYQPEKELILSYEATLADLAGNKLAVDSLKALSAALGKTSYILDKVMIEERIFIEYENAAISQQAKYGTKNPIPETPVYNRGSVYRLLVGSYQAKQQPNIFRGAYPLSYTNEGGRFQYYAGGYRTPEEAKEGQALLKKAGFRNPEIVWWDNGSKVNLSQEQAQAAASGVRYRIEIGYSDDDLKPAVKEAILSSAPGKEIARAANTDGAIPDKYIFTVGSFDTRSAAERTLDAILEHDGGIAAKIVEIK